VKTRSEQVEFDVDVSGPEQQISLARALVQELGIGFDEAWSRVCFAIARQYEAEDLLPPNTSSPSRYRKDLRKLLDAAGQGPRDPNRDKAA
jgi:hypothetical protein